MPVAPPPLASLEPTLPEHEPLFAHLVQLYAYDFSAMTGADVGPDGRFETPAIGKWWTDPVYQPFLIRVAGACAGFAVVSARSRLVENGGARDVAEFFVLRKYRRSGVGARAARLAFDTFRGPWEVRQIHQNSAATAFWRRVIAGYTGGRWREVVWDDARWRGPVQLFDSSADPAP